MQTLTEDVLEYIISCLSKLDTFKINVLSQYYHTFFKKLS